MLFVFRHDTLCLRGSSEMLPLLLKIIVVVMVPCSSVSGPDDDDDNNSSSIEQHALWQDYLRPDSLLREQQLAVPQ